MIIPRMNQPPVDSFKGISLPKSYLITLTYWGLIMLFAYRRACGGGERRSFSLSLWMCFVVQLIKIDKLVSRTDNPTEHTATE